MKIKNLKIDNHLIKLIASGALITVLGVGAYKKSKPIEKEYNSTKLRGIDVSSFQEEYDWELIQKRFDYVIIKTSTGTELDTKFEESFRNANDKDIDIGLYVENNVWKSSIDNSLSDEEKLVKYQNKVNEQVDFLLTQIKGKNPRWPIYLKIDTENITEELPKEYAEVLLNTFKEKIIASGNKPGIFCEKSGYDYLKSINANVQNEFATWVYEKTREYGSAQNRLQIISEHDLINKNKDIKMQQAYRYVENTGAKDILNTSPVDYSKVDYYYKPFNYPIGLLAGTIAISLYNEAGYLLDKRKEKRMEELIKLNELKKKLEKEKKQNQQPKKVKKEYNDKRKKQRGKKRKNKAKTMVKR